MSIPTIALLLAMTVLLGTSYAVAQTTDDPSDRTFVLKSAETSLDLSRSERRLIQAGLAAEGFDPGPADGLFGRSTREAIRKWQERRGDAATGYLNADAATALLAAGTQRSEGPKRSVTDTGKQILRDKLILGLSKALKTDDHPKALKFIDRLEELGGDLPPAVDYFRGEAYIHTGRYGEAQRALNRYFEKTGRKGRYYQKSLNLMLVAEEKIAAREKMLNERDKDGNTPLHRAAWNDEDPEAAMTLATKLIVLGIDVDAKNMSGKTPLHYASKYRNHEIVDLLIERGAAVDAKDKDGKTPLHEAATYQSGFSEEFLAEPSRNVSASLIKAGAYVHARDKDGETPLHKAAASVYGGYEVVRLLIKAGARVNARDEHGRTPLAVSHSSAMISLLRSHGGRR